MKKTCWLTFMDLSVTSHDDNDDDDDDDDVDDDDSDDDVCMTVKVGNKHSCAVYGGQPVRTDVGFLPLSLTGPSRSTSASGTAVGSASCPWMIQMHRGQRVNLTFMNFNQQVRACHPQMSFKLRRVEFRVTRISTRWNFFVTKFTGWFAVLYYLVYQLDEM